MPAFGKLASLGSFAAGITNRQQPVRLVSFDRLGNPKSMLQVANNVDIHDSGYIKRRRGYSRAVAGMTHSLWSTGEVGYVVAGGKLCELRVQAGALHTHEVRPYSGMDPISYAKAPTGDIYWSNSRELRRISAGQDKPATTPAPNPRPGVTIGAGAMPAGQYLVAFTRIEDSESPATEVQAIDVPEGSSLQFSGMDASTVAYVSDLNGEVLTDAQGARCQTVNKAAMPAGQIVRVHRGRLLVASGNVLWFSEPYFYGITDPLANFIQFPERITVLEVTEEGVFVCSDQTYWISGDAGQHSLSSMRAVAPYGGIEGSGCAMRNQDRVFWVSPRGLVVGMPDGSVQAVQAHALTFGGAARAASLFREQDGQVQCLFTEIEPQPAIGAARSHPTLHQGKK